MSQAPLLARLPSLTRSTSPSLSLDLNLNLPLPLESIIPSSPNTLLTSHQLHRDLQRTYR